MRWEAFLAKALKIFRKFKFSLRSSTLAKQIIIEETFRHKTGRKLFGEKQYKW